MGDTPSDWTCSVCSNPVTNSKECATCGTDYLTARAIGNKEMEKQKTRLNALKQALEDPDAERDESHGVTETLAKAYNTPLDSGNTDKMAKEKPVLDGKAHFCPDCGSAAEKFDVFSDRSFICTTCSYVSGGLAKEEADKHAEADQDPVVRLAEAAAQEQPIERPESTKPLQELVEQAGSETEKPAEIYEAVYYYKLKRIEFWKQTDKIPTRKKVRIELSGDSKGKSYAARDSKETAEQILYKIIDAETGEPIELPPIKASSIFWKQMDAEAQRLWQDWKALQAAAARSKQQIERPESTKPLEELAQETSGAAQPFGHSEVLYSPSGADPSKGQLIIWEEGKFGPKTKNVKLVVGKGPHQALSLRGEPFSYDLIDAKTGESIRGVNSLARGWSSVEREAFTVYGDSLRSEGPKARNKKSAAPVENPNIDVDFLGKRVVDGKEVMIFNILEPGTTPYKAMTVFTKNGMYELDGEYFNMQRLDNRQLVTNLPGLRRTAKTYKSSKKFEWTFGKVVGTTVAAGAAIGAVVHDADVIMNSTAPVPLEDLVAHTAWGAFAFSIVPAVISALTYKALDKYEARRDRRAELAWREIGANREEMKAMQKEWEEQERYSRTQELARITPRSGGVDRSRVQELVDNGYSRIQAEQFAAREGFGYDIPPPPPPPPPPHHPSAEKKPQSYDFNEKKE